MGKEKRTLHFELIEQSVKSEHVVAFIDELACNATANRLAIIVLDNARFHTRRKVKEKRLLWEEQGVFLRYLPPYTPHLNPIENLWKRLKSFLLPRSCYNSVVQLKQAVLEALHLLGSIRINSSVGDT